MKRIFTSILALTMILALSCGARAAVDVSAPRASLTISDYTVALKAGTTSGEIRISYEVTATKPADSLGVSSIVIYKADGSYVTTITGTTSNGLVLNSDFVHDGTYSYKGTSGASYYAKVTIFATIGTTSDSRTVTTATVKAP